MKNKQKYTPIPFRATDDRVFVLKYQTTIFSSLGEELTQLDILQIMKHLKGRNSRLYYILKDLIADIDYKENTRTDFKRRIPQRRYNENDDDL